jgi:hypothetical protein
VIDRNARENLAQAIRAFVSGNISNVVFEERVLSKKTKDIAINEIFFSGAWHLYSDGYLHKFDSQQQLSASDKSSISRWILFLNHDFVYKWPTLKLWQLALCFLTFGLAKRCFQSRHESIGDIDVWPFFTRSDYEWALQNPKYLKGHLNVHKLR